jgi:hypothetical protein
MPLDKLPVERLALAPTSPRSRSCATAASQCDPRTR